MFAISYILSIVFSLFVITSCEQKINIDILYESLCPDSLDFVLNQLYPSYNEIAPFLNINFIPFGKSASVNNGEDFVCQHGPKECAGNKIQSCALHALKSQQAQLEFVNCFMKTFKKNKTDNKQFGQMCVINNGLDWNYIKTCYESELGTQLQLIAEERTKQVKPRFIPTIIYNGVFNQRAQDESLLDFKGVVCSMIQQFNPTACQEQEPSVFNI